MEILVHPFEELLAVLGRVLLAIVSGLVLEELMLGGLARLLLSMPPRTRRGGKKQ